MSNNVNSFTETTNQLVRQVNVALETLVKMNQSITAEEDTVNIEVERIDEVTGDPSIYSYSIPSYNYTLSELSRIKNSVDSFISGQGVVLLDDDTYREVKTVSVAKSPAAITNVFAPGRFNYRPNWFFEKFIFPEIYVEFDLKDKIDDRSNRVKTRRILFDNYDDVETQWFKNNFVNKALSYSEALSVLDDAGKKYWLDEEVHFLPLTTNKYTGRFQIVNKQTINGTEWFYLNTINYGLTTDDEIVKDHQLTTEDKLRYGDSLYKISSINVSEKRVTLVSITGITTPSINNSFYIYSPPFEEKLLKLPIGYNECNILFIKGINEDYNLLADQWGDSISFYTNDLTLVKSTSKLDTFYYNHVIDFGKKMEAEAKEKFIPAFLGLTPDSPEITSDQFKVKQINTQLNAALDTDSIKATQSQIESIKTIINSLKTTIAQQKAELVELTDSAERADLQDKIDSNTSQLNKNTVEYQSLVRSLATLAYENESVLGKPKYRIRGFFDIPEGKRTSENTEENKQEIIQFEIAYRYLRLDNTANSLNTYTFEDPDTGQTIEGTYTDWEIKQSNVRKRKYNSDTEQYEWDTENISDAEALNINQVDIPITKGEKVQLKIRSISEAGWPFNPQKSEWSERVIIDFPPDAEGSEQVYNILEEASAEETSIKLEETLQSAGVYTHLRDGMPNPGAAEGTYFKHQSRFIAVDWERLAENNTVVDIRSMDLQNLINNIPEKTFVTLSKPSGADAEEPNFKTVTLQEVLQKLIGIHPSKYDELENNN